MIRILWLIVGICVLALLFLRPTSASVALSGAIHLLLVLAILSALIFLAARRRVT